MPIEHELMSVSSGPGGCPGVPCAPRLRHQLDDVAVLQHDIVRGDFARGRAELPDRGVIVAHAGVVQHDHVGLGAVLALAVVRRRPDLSDDAGIGRNSDTSITIRETTHALQKPTDDESTELVAAGRDRLCRNDDATQAQARLARAIAANPRPLLPAGRTPRLAATAEFDCRRQIATGGPTAAADPGRSLAGR